MGLNVDMSLHGLGPNPVSAALVRGVVLHLKVRRLNGLWNHVKGMLYAQGVELLEVGVYRQSYGSC